MKKPFEHTRNWDIDIFKFNYPLEDSNSVNLIFRQIEDISKKRKIILNLTEVKFLNSTFIWYIFHLYETSKNFGWFVYLVDINPWIKDILNLTWILDTIPYYRTIDSALKNIPK